MGSLEPVTALRLLPWPSAEGKPCYLVPDPEGGYLSRLADDMEAVQLGMGADVLGHARKVLGDAMSPETEVRYAGVRLAECLSDVLRVAESRGMRLPMSGGGDDAEGASCQSRPAVTARLRPPTPLAERPSGGPAECGSPAESSETYEA